MKCQDVENLLSQYIENDLSKDDYNIISTHLKTCKPCQQLKDSIEQLISSLPDLEEDVPFFLKNRLYYIPESLKTERERNWSHFKWIAATVGSIILFLNLFYFTDIYPSANKVLHTVVSDIQRIAVETGSFFEKIKETRELYSFIDTDSLLKEETKKEIKKNDGIKGKGGKDG